MEKKRRKTKKGRWKIENGRGEKFQNEVRTFFLFVCFLFVCLFVCFLFAFHFSKPLKFILDLPECEFSTGGKSQEK